MKKGAVEKRDVLCRVRLHFIQLMLRGVFKFRNSIANLAKAFKSESQELLHYMMMPFGSVLHRNFNCESSFLSCASRSLHAPNSLFIWRKDQSHVYEMTTLLAFKTQPKTCHIALPQSLTQEMVMYAMASCVNIHK